MVKNRACVGCHQLGQLVHAHDPGVARRVRVVGGGVDPPRAVGTGRAAHADPAGPGRSAARPSSTSATGPTASRRASCRTASRRGPQGVERNIVVTTWEWGDPKKYLHDLIASDRRYPTVNAYGQLYGSPEYATDDYPDPRSQDAHRHDFTAPGARRRHAGGARARTRRAREADGAVALLGRGEDLGHQGQQPQRHVRPEGPGLVRGGGARARTTRTSARRARTIPRPSCSRWSGRTARSRSSIRRR